MKKVGILFLNLSAILLFSLFVFATSSFAATYYDRPAPTGDNYQVVSASFCNKPAVCANSQNPSNCGLPACDGGNTWTKYELTCIRDLEFGDYDGYYQQGPVICSIGDKCSAGNTTLQAGFCDCATGSTYKYCCDVTGAPEACIAAGTQDNNPPPEGQCPGGYIVDGDRVRSSACTPIITSTPTPTPSLCINNDPCTAGQVGSSVCSASGGVKTCLNWGGTYCWGTTTPSCPAGTTCYAGVCGVCQEGATRSICIQSQSCNL